MKEIIIKGSDSNIRFDKYLFKLLPNCNKSLIYKLLRKKYFEINNIKAKGDEILRSGDSITIFLSDETYDKFIKNNNDNELMEIDVDINEIKSRVIYEDENIIIYNKKEGEFSQKHLKESISINEKLKYYLKYNDFSFSSTYNPSVINRLDTNTKGLIIFAKTYNAANVLSRLLKTKLIKKYYITYVNGIFDKKNDTLYGKYAKDEINNKAYIQNINIEESAISENVNDDIVITKYELVKNYKDYSVLDIDLITGKSHQIRAHLSSIGHPLICDKKYMNEKLYLENKKRFKQNHQDLTCYKLVFPNNNDLNALNLSNMEFRIEIGDMDKYEKI